MKGFLVWLGIMLAVYWMLDPGKPNRDVSDIQHPRYNHASMAKPHVAETDRCVLYRELYRTGQDRIRPEMDTECWDPKQDAFDDPSTGTISIRSFWVTVVPHSGPDAGKAHRELFTPSRDRREITAMTCDLYWRQLPGRQKLMPSVGRACGPRAKAQPGPDDPESFDLRD